jgi:hypothetical protein
LPHWNYLQVGRAGRGLCNGDDEADGERRIVPPKLPREQGLECRQVAAEPDFKHPIRHRLRRQVGLGAVEQRGQIAGLGLLQQGPERAGDERPAGRPRPTAETERE